MTWEETIIEIRSNPKYNQLVHEAYIGEDIAGNANRFAKSEEFLLTLASIKEGLQDNRKRSFTLLDIGAGNGIATIAFALNGFKVTALEPEPSNTVGAGAIRQLVKDFKLESSVTVEEAWGESLPFEDNSFDIVYCRQVLHHAVELNQFVAEAARVLRVRGVLVTTRDHVITSRRDKVRFLKRHPLHKFYGGENAFLLEEYEGAFTAAGLKVAQRMGPTDSAINYAPWSKNKVREILKKKIGFLHVIPALVNLAFYVIKIRLSRLPGRLYSFIATKNETQYDETNTSDWF